MKFYVVIYSDYDIDYDIRGIFTDESKAEKCKEYELKRIGEITYGESVHIVISECSDNEDFDSKFLELEEKNDRNSRESKKKLKLPIWQNLTALKRNIIYKFHDFI